MEELEEFRLVIVLEEVVLEQRLLRLDVMSDWWREERLRVPACSHRYQR